MRTRPMLRSHPLALLVRRDPARPLRELPKRRSSQTKFPATLPAPFRIDALSDSAQKSTLYFPGLRELSSIGTCPINARVFFNHRPKPGLWSLTDDPLRTASSRPRRLSRSDPALASMKCRVAGGERGDPVQRNIQRRQRTNFRAPPYRGRANRSDGIRSRAAPESAQCSPAVLRLLEIPSLRARSADRSSPAAGALVFLRRISKVRSSAALSDHVCVT